MAPLSRSRYLNAARQLPNTTDHNRYEAILNIFKGVEEYILDVNGIIVGSNLEAVTITGYEEWEVIGRHFSIFYSIEEQVKRVYEYDLEKAVRVGSCFVSGLKMKKRNFPFWAKMKLTSLLDNNIVSGFRLTIQDATHRAIYSHNFNLIKDEYLNLFNNPFVGIFKFRISDYKILLLNEKAETFFGKDWHNKHLNSFLEDSKFQAMITRLTEARKVENVELELTDHERKKRWVSASVKLFSTVGFAEGVLVDITDRKNETERALNLSNELESFIYHASHDLRSPITSIYGLVNLLQKECSEASAEKYGKLIEGRLHHLDNILRDIVQIAFNTAVPIQPEPIDFRSELNTITSQQAKTYSNVTFFTDIRQDEQTRFQTDLTRLRTILRNIVSNAFKFSNRNAGECFVRIEVVVSDKESCITIRDNGIGIALEHTERIFSIFNKATESYKGNGLGLYIAKSMVSKLRGEIDLKSTPGKGTTIHVLIPNSQEQKL